MVAQIRFDVGASVGTPGEARNDATPNTLITINSVGAGTTHTLELLDTTQDPAPSLANPTSTTWTFTTPAGEYHAYRFKLDVDGDVEIRTLRTPLPDGSLVLAYGEKADPDATILSNDADLSEDNAGGNYRGWVPAINAAIRKVDQLAVNGGGAARNSTFGQLRVPDARFGPTVRYLLQNGSLADSGPSGITTLTPTGTTLRTHKRGLDLQWADGTSSSRYTGGADAEVQLTGEMSVEFLFSLDYDSSPGSDPLYLISCGNAGETEPTNVVWAIWLDTATKELQLFHETGAGSNQQFDTGFVLQEGDVYYICMTRTDVGSGNCVYRMFVDKKLVATSGNLTLPSGGTTSTLQLLGTNAVASGAVRGAIAGIQIYDGIVLTEAQVAEMYEYITSAELDLRVSQPLQTYKKLGVEYSPDALYLFNGDLLDASGNGYHLSDLLGDGAGAHTTEYLEALPGLTGVLFDTDDQHRLSVTDAALAYTGDVTIQVLLMSAVAADDNVTQSVLSIGTTGTNFYADLEYSSGTSGMAATNQGNTGASVARMGYRHVVNLAQWVRESNVWKFRLNGRDIGSGGSGALTATGTPTLRIGAIDGNPGSNPFSGAVFCVKINGSALTDAQLLAEAQRSGTAYDGSGTQLSVLDPPYQELSASDILDAAAREVGVDTSGGAVTVTLSDLASMTRGAVVRVHDISGDAGVNTLTISTTGGDTFEDATTSKTITTNYQQRQFRATSLGWVEIFTP